MDLRLDGYTGEATLLDDAQFIRRLIVSCAELAGMTIINGPTIVSFKEFGPDAGLSGFAVIAESHISIHTWPVERYVMIDVVSCKYFDPAAVKTFFQESLALEITRYQADPKRTGPQEVR